MRSKKVVESDLKILRFLWRWKLMSTAGVSTFLYGKADTQHAYRRLLCLHKLRLIETRTNSYDNKVLWGLSKGGYKLMRSSLPTLSSDGYRSESNAHDFLSSVFHLGPVINNPSDKIEIFTEQELRRVDPEDFPQWVPKDMTHRCDGYWRMPINDKQRIIGLEVELSRQKHSRYRDIARYYESNASITRIIWLVRNERQAINMQNSMREEVGENVRFHNFVLYPDFLERGWDAPLKLGAENGIEMSRLFVPIRDYPPTSSYPKGILDLSKRPRDSGSYKLFHLDDFCL